MADMRKRLGVIVGLCETFGRELSEDALDAYLTALDDLTDDELEHAAGWCLKNREFFPPPAALRAAAGKREPSLGDRAIRAWAEAWDAVTAHGSYASVVFADPATAKTIAVMGGWPAFCRPTQDAEWHRKEFLDTYAGLAGTCEPGPVKLLGIHEKGGRNVEPVAIGVSSGEARLLTAEDVDVPASPESARRFIEELRAAAEKAPTEGRPTDAGTKGPASTSRRSTPTGSTASNQPNTPASVTGRASATPGGGE